MKYTLQNTYTAKYSHCINTCTTKHSHCLTFALQNIHTTECSHAAIFFALYRLYTAENLQHKNIYKDQHTKQTSTV